MQSCGDSASSTSRQKRSGFGNRPVGTRDELPIGGILLCDRKDDVVTELTLMEEFDIYASK